MKTFHITPSGRAVLGEPPVVGTSPIATPREPRAVDSGLRVEEWIEHTSKSVFSTKSLVIAGSILLLVAAVTYMSSGGPETVQKRVAKVAEAAVQGDLQTVRWMSASGTTDDAVKWYESIRDRCDQFRQQMGTNTMIVEVLVNQENEKLGTAETVARVDTREDIQRRGAALPDPSISALSTPSSSISFPVAMKSEGWGGWKLDGRRTLELTNVSR
jgi:hypothetical protein